MRFLDGKFAEPGDQHASRAYGGRRAPGSGQFPRAALGRPARLIAAATALPLPVSLSLPAVIASASPAHVGWDFVSTPPYLASLPNPITIG